MLNSSEHDRCRCEIVYDHMQVSGHHSYFRGYIEICSFLGITYFKKRGKETESLWQFQILGKHSCILKRSPHAVRYVLARVKAWLKLKGKMAEMDIYLFVFYKRWKRRWYIQCFTCRADQLQGSNMPLHGRPLYFINWVLFSCAVQFCSFLVIAHIFDS